ncbi:hypothetical protein F5876DRAFT_52960 [Lentinula aff. lateritia]|uniref:Uncharacterized protein n=1 Tax=Lentinula aff. lateritia TaxID=2804960 RepID=A0ACC1TJH6_9AGAR|nr:hypothetical protein F5876DRAFT_52960 [Lentinula aff. lateritia]
MHIECRPPLSTNPLFHRNFHRYRTGQYRQRLDGRTWKHRIRRLNKNWQPLIPALIDAYTTWKYSPPPHIVTYTDPDASPLVDGRDFDINILDIHDLARVAVIPCGEDDEGAVALVRAGYLGCTPQRPSLAISLRTLELFYTIRMFRPSFSIEAFTKVVCHVHSVTYRRGYRSAISDAFDTYIIIRRHLDSRVAHELGQDTQNYRVLNSCPPCNYELKDEPPLKFSRMFVLDGNNSLKRMQGAGNRQVADDRVYQDSDYFLPEEYVNQFGNEVPRGRTQTEDEDAEEPGLEQGGDPTDGQTSMSETSPLQKCTSNWKAAAGDAAKKMWDGFHETGIFASACRHGFIIWLTDMIRSGELAKYPLAITAKALEVFGENLLIGYDIGCSFSETIAKTSLNEAFQKKKCRTCVNAFHGYSHNALCQQSFHPTHIKGMGLEDLETLERIFSQSNQLAAVTRYMSRYHRKVFIDLFFRQWDSDKYANLGTMLFNNYIQALHILETEAAELAHDLEQFNLTESDLEAMWVDQAGHFKELGKERAEEVNGVAYVELLQQLRDIEAALERSYTAFRIQEPEDFEQLPPHSSYSSGLSETRKTETRRHFLGEKRDNVLWEILQMESQMDVRRRWTPLDSEYKAALKYMTERKYLQALENLHLLVIKRLFEMHKLNMSGTGYKMRTHIAQALQRRAKAIRNAVNEYNKHALMLDPPRDTLDWTKVTHFSFIDQFDILRDTRHNVFHEKWAQPLYRELMNRVHKVSRAREEIHRVNIELRRLHTRIVDEEKLFASTLEHLRGSLMLGPVLEYVTRRREVNKLLISRINATYNLPGFTGTPWPGESINPVHATYPHTPSASEMHEPDTSPPTSPGHNAGSSNVPHSTPDDRQPQFEDDNSEDEGPLEDDDEFVDDMGKVVDFIAGL